MSRMRVLRSTDPATEPGYLEQSIIVQMVDTQGTLYYISRWFWVYIVIWEKI